MIFLNDSLKLQIFRLPTALYKNSLEDRNHIAFNKKIFRRRRLTTISVSIAIKQEIDEMRFWTMNALNKKIRIFQRY